MTSLALACKLNAARTPTSLAARAVAAIRRNNGTLLLPGAATPLPGGLFAFGNPPLKNYLDSAMTTLLDTSTGIDQPVGGVVDSVGTRNATQATTASKPILRRGLVNQLLYSQLGGGGTAPTGWSAVGAGGVEGALLPSGMRQRVFTSTASQDYIWQSVTLAASTVYTVAVSVDANPSNYANGALVAAINMPAGATAVTASTGSVAAVGGMVLMTVTTSTTAGSMLLRCGPGSQGSNTTGTVTLSAPAIFAGTVTAAQILAAGGIPATTTAAASSALGRYWWQFDGSNDSLQTSITTGNEGWVCAGVTFGGAAGALETVFCSGAVSDAQKGVWLFRNGGLGNVFQLTIGNGTSRSFLTTDVGGTLLGNRRVVEAGWSPLTAFKAVDGVEASSARTGDASPSAATALIGASTAATGYLNGPMSATVYTPVLPSAADRALIRRFVGSLQGQTL